MTWSLVDKVAVITGGAEGIGYEIADKYLQEKARIVFILDINEQLGIEAVNNLTTKYGKSKAIFMKCDVAVNLGDVLKEIFKAFVVDILVNNAGVADETVPKKMIDINLTSYIESSLYMWEHMRKDKGGNGATIINISSIFGISTNPFFPVYHSSKHGVVAFTKSLGHRSNFERSGVRVVAICPGITETKLMIKGKNWDSSMKDVVEQIVKSLPVQKVDAVGKAAVEIYKRADSGTAWKIEGAKPIVDVTEKCE